ncbi:SGNH/GDSL hydrolase family protein [Enterococcus casseliflavus]|uniref:SGNH/GDSL hydrolase family protein n=1 Tax=Enterococcus casseliflavus TaxID=37734 RepID=UPI00177CAE16|nr:SGNH/GDSL hydrolase family protein [Enterococcus casseliflavus]QOG30903.1 SGNH/GDSL hydrolase family protein [Enterococcus casseliflavus]
MELDQFRNVDLVIDRANDSFVQKQFVSQGDYKGRSLTVQITNNGVVGEVPGLTLNLYWQNQASGLADLSAFYVLDKENSVFRIDYPEHMMTPGKVIASVQIIQNGKVTQTKNFELTVQSLAGKAVGIVDKAEFSALVAVLADANQFRTDIDKKADKEDINQRLTLLKEETEKKSDKSYVDSMLSSIAQGGPRELFYSLLALQTKYPNGADGTYLVFDSSASDGAHVYMYDNVNNLWKDLGVYQQSYNDAILSTISDNFTGGKRTFYSRSYLTGISGSTIGMSNHENCFVVKLENIPTKGKLYVNKSVLARGQFIITTNSDDGFINNFEFGYGTGATSNYMIYPENGYIVIDLYYLNRLSASIRNLYLSFEGLAKESLTTLVKDSYDITEIFQWADMSKYLAYKNWGALLDEYQPIDRTVNSGKSLNGYNTTTGEVQFGTNNNLKTIFYSNIPKNGTMAIPKSKITSGQFIVFTKDGKGVANLDYRYSDGTTSIYYMKVTDKEIIFDFSMIDLQYKSLGVNGMYLCTSNTIDFYNRYSDVVDYNDIFSFVKLPSQTHDVQTLIPVSVPKMATSEALIFLDNFIKDGNAYENNNLVSTTKSIAQQPIAYIASADTSVSFDINDKAINVSIDNIARDKSGTAKILVLGESTSDNNGTMGGIKTLTDADSNINVTYIGTRTNSGVPNEAFSGWGVGTLRYAQTANTYINPFYNPATSQFDYDYYLTQTGQSVPDIVFINFGINDVNRYTDKTTSMTDTYEFIINQIKAKNANCKFVIGLTHSYARYGNYKNDPQRKVIIDRVEVLQNYFKNKESNNIFLAPFYAVVDPINDRPTKLVGDYAIGTDPIHLTADGYKRSMSSMMYTILKRVL